MWAPPRNAATDPSLATTQIKNMEDPGAARLSRFDEAVNDSLLRGAIIDQDVDGVRRFLATPGYRFPATPSAVACAVGRPAVVRAILRDGRADLTLQSVDYPTSTALVYALDSLRFSGISTTKFLPRSLADCVRALITKDPRLADIFYRVTPGMLRYAVKKASRFACLEVLYLMLAALPQINRLEPVLTCGEPVFNPELDSLSDFELECSEKGLEGLLARVGSAHYHTPKSEQPLTRSVNPRSHL